MLRILCILATATGSATLCVAQPVPDYDFQWRTIGAPGNRPANQTEAPQLYPPYSIPAFPVGAVGYEYRMARTEVTAGQLLEFLNAYWPHFNGFYNDVSLTGAWIRASSTVPGQNPGYHLIIPGSENYGTDISWRNAARYCNWLTNNKATTAAAFESGAYDASTFTQNSDGTLNDQLAHSPGALFWISTLDEWTKSMYFAPDRYGPGQEGYWYYPTSSDTAPFPGPPGSGFGQTSYGLPFLPHYPVGSYGSVQSPWGLLDGSGGVSEYTEFADDPGRRSRVTKGTGQGFSTAADWLDSLGADSPILGDSGVRLASAVPSPSTVMPMVLLFILPSRRRRCDSFRWPRSSSSLSQPSHVRRTPVSRRF